ncbi:MAG TPA: transglycosylase, partial [Desulfonauticus sp.]|nr:transglycosylase [Desulfonauticus sp.]
KDEVTMQSIYRVLKDNPLFVDEILPANPSYVFFKLAEEGPFGCITQPLTPWVSVASNNSFVPWGGVLLVEGVLPGLVGDKFFTSLLAVQDTGGAIKGEHLDLFCGSGWEAEFVAGRLQHRARVYLLLRKGEND